MILYENHTWILWVRKTKKNFNEILNFDLYKEYFEISKFDKKNKKNLKKY